MAKIQAGISDADNAFNLDGLDYPKNRYEIYYDGKSRLADGSFDEDVIRVGIRSINNSTHGSLQKPLRVSDWTDASDAAYTTLTDLVRDLITFVGFSNGGGSGSGAVVPSEDQIFDSVAERDTYFTNNPDELFTGLPIFVTVGGNVQYQIWSGGEVTTYTPATDAVNWVQAGAFTGTAAQIKTLYESNADTNAFTDALLAKLNGIEAGATADQTGAEIVSLVQGESDVNLIDDDQLGVVEGLEGVDDTYIPVKSGGTSYENSPLRYDGDVIISTATIQTPDSSVVIGGLSLSNVGFGLGIEELSTDEIFYPAGVKLMTDGTTAPFYVQLGELPTSPIILQPSSAETFTGTSIQFAVSITDTVVQDGTAVRYYYDSAINTSDVNLTIRRNSHTDSNPVFDFKRANDDVGFDVVSGQNFVELPALLFIETNTTYYVTIESTNNLSLRGATVGGETIPYFGVLGRTYDEITIENTQLTEEQVYDLVSQFIVQGTNMTIVEDDNTNTITLSANGSSGTYAAPSVHNFSIDIPSRVDLNTDLNVDHVFTFSVTNRQNIQTFEAVITNGNDVTLTNPTSDGEQSQTHSLSGIDSSTSKDVTITLRITDTQGNTHDSNTVTIRIQDLEDHEQTHFGFVQSTQDQTDIVFATNDIEARDQADGTWTVSTLR